MIVSGLVLVLFLFLFLFLFELILLKKLNPIQRSITLTLGMSINFSAACDRSGNRKLPS